MAVKNIIKAITVTPFDATTLNNNFQVINGTGLPQACSLLRIANSSTASVQLSFDGVNVNEFLLNASSTQLPVQSNSQPNNSLALFPVGTLIYAKLEAGAAPMAGSLYVIGYYQPSVN
jgi:hypothetical protein